MLRLACVLVVVAACSSSGPGTGPGMMSGVMPEVKSSAATPFTGPDASGKKVMGWTIDFYSSSVGSDCKSKGSKVVASIGIFTNQAAGSAKTATLQPGDIGIVSTSPPDTSSGAAATMGAMGVSGLQGSVSIGDFASDHISGTVAAGGFDVNNSPVTLNGTFDAPTCE